MHDLLDQVEDGAEPCNDEGRVLWQDANHHPHVDLELESVLGRHEQLAEAEEGQAILALFRQVRIVRFIRGRIRRTTRETRGVRPVGPSPVDHDGRRRHEVGGESDPVQVVLPWGDRVAPDPPSVSVWNEEPLDGRMDRLVEVRAVRHGHGLDVRLVEFLPDVRTEDRHETRRYLGDIVDLDLEEDRIDVITAGLERVKLWPSEAYAIE